MRERLKVSSGAFVSSYGISRRSPFGAEGPARKTNGRLVTFPCGRVQPYGRVTFILKIQTTVVEGGNEVLLEITTMVAPDAMSLVVRQRGGPNLIVHTYAVSYSKLLASKRECRRGIPGTIVHRACEEAVTVMGRFALGRGQTDVDGSITLPQSFVLYEGDGVSGVETSIPSSPTINSWS